MLSFSSLTLFAIAASSLFAGVNAAVLPIRQSEPPSQGGRDLVDIFASVDLSSLIGVGPINVDVTIGLDGDESTIIEVIHTVLNDLVGDVDVTVVIGQPPLSIGLGLTPSDDKVAGGFDSSSIVSQLAEPLSKVISDVLGGGDFTVFPISLLGFKGSPSGLAFPTESIPFNLPIPTDV